eukprot:1157339-Pelagomonas_calceolata.AAC.9
MQGLIRNAAASAQESCLRVLQPVVSMALRGGQQQHIPLSTPSCRGWECFSTQAEVPSSSTSPHHETHPPQPPHETQAPPAANVEQEDAQQAQADTEQQQPQHQQQEGQAGHETWTSQQPESVQAQHQKPRRPPPRGHPAFKVPLPNKQQAKEARLSSEALKIYDKLVGCLMKDGKKHAAQVRCRAMWSSGTPCKLCKAVEVGGRLTD